jgi:hypothetical protein
MPVQVIMAVLTPASSTSRTVMPAAVSLPITPVLGQLRDLIADGESVPDVRQVASLMQVLAAVPDPRARRGVRHRLLAVPVMSVCAVLGGMRSFVAIAQWAHDSVESCRRSFVSSWVSRAPAESTFRRTLQRLDAAELDRLLGAWAQTRVARLAGQPAGLRAVAADGKTLCGSGSPAPAAHQPAQRHLLAAFDHTSGVVLGQVDVDAKTNEVPMLPTLLDRLDLTGVVAAHTCVNASTPGSRAAAASGSLIVYIRRRRGCPSTPDTPVPGAVSRGATTAPTPGRAPPARTRRTAARSRRGCAL